MYIVIIGEVIKKVNNKLHIPSKAAGIKLKFVLYQWQEFPFSPATIW